MKVVCDIEANSLVNPTHIWVIVCKDVDSGELHIFRKVTEDVQAKELFLQFAKLVETWIGHNWLEYDYPHLNRLLGLSIPDVDVRSTDTLILSRLVDYSREGGHSIEQYGLEFGLEKIQFNNFKEYSQEMEDYCVRDVQICEKVYRKFIPFTSKTENQSAIRLEHSFQLVVNSLHNNGFAFNSKRARTLLDQVTKELELLDKEILNAFPPREVIVREFIPRLTKHGTISRTSIPRSLHGNIHLYEAGRPYQLTKWVEFNPASHKQILQVLNEAGWKPVDKTKSHTDTLREVNRLKRSRDRDQAFDITLNNAIMKLQSLERVGFKVNETNLLTLPEAAPAPARTLARRILYEDRRRTLTQWLGLVQDNGRIHGKFVGIGAWTHRMAHQKPNTANIANEFDLLKRKRLLGKEMRSLWCAPKNRLLVGVDAEGIQLRIFAHYIDDKEFTDALVNGRKSDKTDPHSLNQRILGSVCSSRAAAKRFIFALLLGAGIGKLAEILAVSEDETKTALERLMVRYTGFTHLKETVLPSDGRRGYIVGLDGRHVRLPAETASGRTHLAMSGYLQNGEAIIIKRAAVHFVPLLPPSVKLVNIVHDEYQLEAPNNMDLAISVATIVSDAIAYAGEYYHLKCPQKGSYWSEDLNDYTIATNWAYTH